MHGIRIYIKYFTVSYPTSIFIHFFYSLCFVLKIKSLFQQFVNYGCSVIYKTNIQYACQRYYFGAMADKYFDDKTRDAATNVQHRLKTIEAFNRLPDEFTIDDVVRCFSMPSVNAARTRTHRLVKDGLAEKTGEYVENGTTKAKYKKTGRVAL